MKLIIFKHNRNFGNDIYEEEVQFDDNYTEEEVNKEYVKWILERVGDNFTWYEKE